MSGIQQLPRSPPISSQPSSSSSSSTADKTSCNELDSNNEELNISGRLVVAPVDAQTILLKVPKHVAHHWMAAGPGTIVGVKINNHQTPDPQRDHSSNYNNSPSPSSKLTNNPSSSVIIPTYMTQSTSDKILPSFNSRSQKRNISELTLGPMEEKKNIHIFEMLKRPNLDGPSAPAPPNNSSPDVSRDSGLSLWSVVSGGRGLVPKLNSEYVATIRDRVHRVMEPSKRTLMSNIDDSVYRSSFNGDSLHHLFKYYIPSDDPDCVTVSSRGEKIPRMSDDQLKEGIFKIFESKGSDGVMFKEFQVKLRGQPHSAIKAIVEEIGEYVAKGTQRFKWFLKKEFRPE